MLPAGADSGASGAEAHSKPREPSAESSSGNTLLLGNTRIRSSGAKLQGQKKG